MELTMTGLEREQDETIGGIIVFILYVNSESICPFCCPNAEKHVHRVCQTWAINSHHELVDAAGLIISLFSKMIFDRPVNCEKRLGK
jgi:hypothetical protein